MHTTSFSSFTLLLAAIALALLLTGCGSSSASVEKDVTSSVQNADDGVAYSELDRREFDAVGHEVRTDQGNRVFVEATEQDTLVWFEDEVTGDFVRALLRQDNSIYMNDGNGDTFQPASSTNEVAYQKFMERWRDAQQPAFAQDNYDHETELRAHMSDDESSGDE